MEFRELMSKRLEDKLRESGLLKEEYFNKENMERADRLYLDISTDGQQISYITKERLTRFDGDVWNEELRRKFAIKTKPGRIVQHIYGHELPYSDQRKLRYMLADLDDYEVRVVSGTDIAKYYNEDMYEGSSGDIYSCMRHCPSSFFKIYEDMAKLAIVIRKTTGRITARSLIFSDVQSAEGYEPRDFMCRIYSNDDIYYDMLKSWGLSNGYYIFDGGYSCSDIIIDFDRKISLSQYKPYIITDAYINDKYSFLPYIDNFMYSVWYRDSEENKNTYVMTPNMDWTDEVYSYHNRVARESNSCYEGGYGVGNKGEWCDCCTAVCADCWYNNHGGWEWYGDEDDDDYDDGMWDDDDYDDEDNDSWYD